MASRPPREAARLAPRGVFVSRGADLRKSTELLQRIGLILFGRPHRGLQPIGLRREGVLGDGLIIVRATTVNPYP